VTKIIDGDTIHVNGESVRFALSSAPELGGFGGVESRDFIDTICPVGSDVIVDEDDSQTGGSYGRIIGVVYCNGVNLNSELLDADLGYLENQFCDSSEFAEEPWAIKHGC
ncbi:MAG: thermonuclease family protein, partial [Nitrosopumilus sp.]